VGVSVAVGRAISPLAGEGRLVLWAQGGEWYGLDCFIYIIINKLGYWD
jgi:hypothetical protein